MSENLSGLYFVELEESLLIDFLLLKVVEAMVDKSVFRLYFFFLRRGGMTKSVSSSATYFWGIYCFRFFPGIQPIQLYQVVDLKISSPVSLRSKKDESIVFTIIAQNFILLIHLLFGVRQIYHFFVLLPNSRSLANCCRIDHCTESITFFALSFLLLLFFFSWFFFIILFGAEKLS